MYISKIFGLSAEEIFLKSKVDEYTFLNMAESIRGKNIPKEEIEVDIVNIVSEIEDLRDLLDLYEPIFIKITSSQ